METRHHLGGTFGVRRIREGRLIARASEPQRASEARQQVPPEPGDLQGRGGERPCSKMEREHRPEEKGGQQFVHSIRDLGTCLNIIGRAS